MERIIVDELLQMIQIEREIERVRIFSEFVEWWLMMNEGEDEELYRVSLAIESGKAWGRFVYN